MRNFFTTISVTLSCVLITACGGIADAPIDPSPNSSSSQTYSSVSSSSNVSSSAPQSSEANSASSSSASNTPELIMAINVGATTPTTYQNVDYQPDQWFASGGSNHSTPDLINNANGSELFNTERYGTFSYEIPVTVGSYDIQLHFAEIYHEQANQRLVNVSIEGERLIEALDIFAEVGGDSAYTAELTNISVADESLSIEISATLGDGTLSGIKVTSLDGRLIEPQPGQNWGDQWELGEDDCPSPNLATPSDLPREDKLPDPFIMLNGERLNKSSEWHCHKQNILAQAQKYIYGTKPPKPSLVTGSVTSNRITVQVEHNNKQIEFAANIVLPSSGQAPFPAIINVGTPGPFGGISLGESRILEQGVAIIYYNHYEMGQEGTPEASRGLANPGKFYDLYGGFHSAGLLQAWAWGASRIIDVLQDSASVIDPARLGVTGCSRNGKGAFAIGLFDQRIALTIPHETSTAGVPALRIVDVLNTERTDHNFNGLNWLSNNFEPFVLNASQLPIDTHTLIGSFAPRGLLILENPHERQMSAPAGFVAATAGAEVYKALGYGQNISYHSDVANTGHCSYKQAYTDLLSRNIAKFLKGEPATTGDFVVGANGRLNLDDWIDWNRPSLEQDN